MRIYALSRLRRSIEVSILVHRLWAVKNEITYPKSKRGDKCNPINERQINNIGCFEEMSIDIEGKKLTGW